MKIKPNYLSSINFYYEIKIKNKYDIIPQKNHSVSKLKALATHDTSHKCLATP